jgi:rubrerythrin
VGVAVRGVEGMSYSSEEMDNGQLTTIDDPGMLREDLASELQANNQYEDHILVLNDEEAVDTLEHIVEEEKKHAAELVGLIQNLDPGQAEKFKEIL